MNDRLIFGGATMRHGYLAHESEEYRQARAKLLDEELALRDHCEQVAALRRTLPTDTEVEDYVFREGPPDLDVDEPIKEVRLSELFANPERPLILYQYMYGGAQVEPCTMCTMWTDGFNGVAPHLRQHVNFVIVAQAPIAEWRAWGRERGWQNLRLVSSAGSTFKTDLHFQDAEGYQYPGLSVFVMASDGSPRHFYSCSALMKEGEVRGLDLYTPVWNLLDLTPQGRGDWMPSLNYGD